MAGDDDDAVFLARKLGNDVAYGIRAGGGLGGEGVVGNRNVSGGQLLLDIGFEFMVRGTADRARTETYGFADILHGAFAVDARRGRGILGEDEIGRYRLPAGGGRAAGGHIA